MARPAAHGPPLHRKGADQPELARAIAALAAISLIAGSGAAIAQTAQPLSLANAPSVQRAGASLDDANGLRRRGAAFYIIGAIVLGLIVWGVIQLTDGNDPDSP